MDMVVHLQNVFAFLDQNCSFFLCEILTLLVEGIYDFVW